MQTARPPRNFLIFMQTRSPHSSKWSCYYHFLPLLFLKWNWRGRFHRVGRPTNRQAKNNNLQVQKRKKKFLLPLVPVRVGWLRFFPPSLVVCVDFSPSSRATQQSPSPPAKGRIFLLFLSLLLWSTYRPRTFGVEKEGFRVSAEKEKNSSPREQLDLKGGEISHFFLFSYKVAHPSWSLNRKISLVLCGVKIFFPSSLKLPLSPLFLA